MNVLQQAAEQKRWVCPRTSARTPLAGTTYVPQTGHGDIFTAVERGAVLRAPRRGSPVTPRTTPSTKRQNVRAMTRNSRPTSANRSTG